MSMTRIKEVRNAAGMSQADLAAAAECVTAGEISKAERGLKDLTPEQLEAVAKALGADPDSLLDPPAAVEALAAAPVLLTAEEQELIELYREADAEKRKMAIAILKGTMGGQDFVNFAAGMLRGIDSAELINAVKNLVLSSKVEDLLAIGKNLMAGKAGMGLMSILTGKPGSGCAGASAGSSADVPALGGNVNSTSKEISVPLLAFTYFYSATIYILLLSFYFWLWRTDIKPEK